MFDRNDMQYFPDEDERNLVHECENCGEDIYVGDECYEALDNQYFCSYGCLIDYFNVQEIIVRREE